MKRAAIVGAGPVGSLHAVMLAKRGWSVSVFERRPDLRTTSIAAGRSINLALSDRGWKALELAGLADEIRKEAIPMSGRMVHFADGKTMFQPYGKEGEAIYSVSRGGLNKQLVELAGAYENIDLHFDHRCIDMDPGSGSITLEHTPTGLIATHKFDHIFGTDGAFSAIRARMMRLEKFDYCQEYLAHDYKELHIPAGQNGEHQLEKNALHIWPRGDRMLIGLPNMDGSFTMTLFMDAKQFDYLNTDEKVADFLQEYFSDALALMPEAVRNFRSAPASSLVMTSCAPWNVGGRVLLLGDAAHAIVPFYGQGMNAGFEDCTELSSMMDLIDDMDVVFSRFANERKPRTDAIRELALRNYLEMRDKTADPEFILQKKIEARLSERYPELWTPLYSLVTFSHTPYDEALKAGDRQDRFMKKVLAIPGAEVGFTSAEFIDRVADMLKN